jgi:HNH endonuclease
VRDLEQLVDDYISDGESPIADNAEATGRRVVFAAPLSAVIAWENGMEIARRVLGWDAPPHRCVEAVLAETAGELSRLPEEGGTSRSSATDAADGSFETGAATESVALGSGDEPFEPNEPFQHDELPPMVESRLEPPKPVVLRVTRRDLRALQDSIRAAESEIKAMASIAAPCADDPDQSIAVLSDLKRKGRGLRLLLARLVRDADAAKVLTFLGYGNVSEFLVSALKMSKRTAARFLSEAWTFEDNPELASAFSSGRIGLGQAYLVNRVALASNLGAFIRRAESVTHLQFEREVRFLERLKDYLPSAARRLAGPLPLDGLEEALKDRLRDLGWTEAAIEERVGTYEVDDPAVDPVLMRRLEALLEMVALGLEEHDSAVAAVPMLATGEAAGATAVSEAPGVVPTLASLAPDQSSAMPMLATLDDRRSELDPLDPHPRRATISFWAPDPLITEWESALARVQAGHGPLPTWAAALFLVQSAVREWERVDPSRRPREWRILERDEWRCQAPGCSSRRRLEVHHIIFRSRGGPNHPENLTTLCHGHHRRGIHDGYLRAEGTAPSNLRWHLGGGKPSSKGKSRPSRVFHGSHLTTWATDDART